MHLLVFQGQNKEYLHEKNLIPEGISKLLVASMEKKTVDWTEQERNILKTKDQLSALASVSIGG